MNNIIRTIIHFFKFHFGHKRWAVFEITSWCNGDTGYHRRLEVARLGMSHHQSMKLLDDDWADCSQAEPVTIPLSKREAEETCWDMMDGSQSPARTLESPHV